MKRPFLPRLLLLLLLCLASVACVAHELPRDESSLQVVTVVVTGTSGPTQTPRVVTELQTVVVTATPAPQGSRSPLPSVAPASVTRRATATPLAQELPNATATTTSRPFPTAQPTDTPPPAAPGFKYAAPELTAPTEQVVISAQAVPILEWEPYPLQEDEWYDVTIERMWQDQPYYAGSDWTKEPTLVVPTFVWGTSDTGEYRWWVTIKRMTGSNASGGKVGTAISPPSEQRTFTWSRE